MGPDPNEARREDAAEEAATPATAPATPGLNSDPGGCWIVYQAKPGEERSTATILLEEYKDHGYWGRHYSTVRLTLGTFFLAVASKIIFDRWDRPETTVAVVAWVIALIGFVLFLMFSKATFEKMNKQTEIINAYRRALAGDRAESVGLRTWLAEWSGGRIGGIVFVAFTCFVVAWALGAFPKKADETGKPAAGAVQEQSNLPIDIQLGGNAPVRINVPVTITTPKNAPAGTK